MTTKQCGDCKWWDKAHKSTFSNGDTCADCNAPIPFWVSNQSNIDKSPYSDEGIGCPVFEERKE